MGDIQIEIQPSEVSVVFQGPIDDKYTPEAIEKVRADLPGAEIILSTWKNSEVEGIDVDKVIFNDDPGCAYDGAEFERALNLNRWIVSSKNGVDATTRKYVLKCRTDVEIENFDFLKYWNLFPKRCEKYELARHKLLIPSVYTLAYLGDGKKHLKISTPFHVSDWYCFGLREDVLEFVSCPVVEDLHAFARYYDNRQHIVPYNRRWWLDSWFRKMAAEQYIGLEYAKRKFSNIEINNVFDCKNITDELSEKFLISNYIILDPKQYGIHLPKFGVFTRKIYILNDDLWVGMYRNSVYKKAYNKEFGETGIVFDYLNTKRNIRKVKECGDRALNKVLSALRRNNERIKNKVTNFIAKHPILHIISFEINHVKKGERIFARIIEKYPSSTEFFVCPYRGTGDSYIVGNYFKKNNKKGTFIVPRELNKKILSWFGIDEVAVINEKDMSLFLDYCRISQNSNIHILHYATGNIQSNTGYNLAGFKKLTFADFYDYLVFGESSPVDYEPIANEETSFEEIFLKYPVERGKTVIVAPYSDSIDTLPMKEWEYIVTSLKNRGFVVVTNCGKNEKAIKGSKSVFVPFNIMTQFADYCGFFISIRSGICDIISTSKCKKYIFYPEFINYKYGSYKNFFTLDCPDRKLFANEYEYKRNNNRNMINRMLRELTNSAEQEKDA